MGNQDLHDIHLEVLEVKCGHYYEQLLKPTLVALVKSAASPSRRAAAHCSMLDCCAHSLLSTWIIWNTARVLTIICIAGFVVTAFSVKLTLSNFDWKIDNLIEYFLSDKKDNLLGVHDL